MTDQITPTPPKDSNSSRNGCLIAAGIIGGIFALGAIIGPKAPAGSGDAPATAAAAPADPAANAVRVTATQLFNAYAANEVAAQTQYGDKPLLVTGTIDDITLDFADDPVIHLGAGNRFDHVAINDLPASVAGSLAKGQQLTVLCTSIREIIGNPQLSDCTVQP